jgi:N-acetylglucosaminyl-diphospho-decaprenol L-rhamnosyltransferase
MTANQDQGPSQVGDTQRHRAREALDRADVEVVVVAYRSRPQVEGLLAGLPADLPVAVVDNSDGSDGLAGIITARPHGRYLRGGGVGFGRAATLGARTSEARYLVFVNPDTRPSLDDLLTLVEDVAADPGLSASAGTLVEPGGRPQIGVGGWEPSIGRALVHACALHKLAPRAGLAARPVLGEPMAVDWVSGGCMAVRRETFLELGGFDPDFYVYCEDVAFGRTSREHGLRQRLRTDVAISGDSGGSGAPSLEMMRLRGASFTHYVRKHNGRARTAAIIAVYALGYAVRALACVLTGRRPRAREHRALTVGCLTGTATVGGRQVVSRRTGRD